MTEDTNGLAVAAKVAVAANVELLRRLVAAVTARVQRLGRP